MDILCYALTRNGERTVFSIDYDELTREYHLYKNETDEFWLNNLVKILHFSVVACYHTNVDMNNSISDIGIIHELVHMLHIPDEPLINLAATRIAFNCAFDTKFK